MNGDASSAFMNRVSAWMSTVWPRILNVTCFAAATAASARAFFARSLSAAVTFGLLVSPGAAAGAAGVESIAAALRGALVCDIDVSHVYCGRALLISYIRCDQR